MNWLPTFADKSASSKFAGYNGGAKSACHVDDHVIKKRDRALGTIDKPNLLALGFADSTMAKVKPFLLVRNLANISQNLVKLWNRVASEIFALKR